MKTYPPGRVHRYVPEDLSFRVAIVNATAVVHEMQTLQNTYPISTLAVGRAMVAAVLMAAQLKPQHQVSLYFRGDGPLEMFFAEATFEGEVRGYSPHPHLEIHKKLGATNLGIAIGSGLLTVVRTLPYLAQAQRSQVEIQSGEVGDDIAYYLAQSVQTPSLVSLGVKVNAYGLVESAGGIIVELMPGAAPELVTKLERNFAERKSLSTALASGGSVADILKMYLRDFKMVELDHPYELSYRCRCSKERLANALTLLGHLEVERLIEENEPAEAKCEFCGRNYILEIRELQELLDRLRAGASH